MLFPTVQFGVFFVVVFTLNWLLRPYFTVWRLVMILASLYFYSAWRREFVLLLLASIVVNWLFGLFAAFRLDRSGEKTPSSRVLVGVGVALNLGVLAYFKYAEFFVRDIANSIPGLEMDLGALDGIILPVGISFFTFQALSYVIDVGRGRIAPMNLIDFALYLSFFPQLVAGPIVRATEFAPQIRRRPDPRLINSALALRLILAGLFKKVVVSSYLASEIVDPVFAVPGEHSSWEILWAIYGYAIQIYADFSGYTDIAIGCALLLGFRFPQNFDAPYIARSIQDFWHRWHMTLSRWLRDYLYIALGGNRKGVNRTYVNLMLTMVLGGIWHGAGWTFVIWGSLHGTYLIVERIVKERWKPIGLPTPVVSAMQWFLTFNLVCLAWVFFRAESFDRAMEMLGQLVGGLGEVSPLVTTLVIVVVVGALIAQFVPQRAVVQVQDIVSRLHWAWQAAILAVGLLFIDTLGPEGVAPFIYFQF